jgi:hypothetical protein
MPLELGNGVGQLESSLELLLMVVLELLFLLSFSLFDALSYLIKSREVFCCFMSWWNRGWLEAGIALVV